MCHQAITLRTVTALVASEKQLNPRRNAGRGVVDADVAPSICGCRKPVWLLFQSTAAGKGCTDNEHQIHLPTHVHPSGGLPAASTVQPTEHGMQRNIECFSLATYRTELEEWRDPLHALSAKLHELSATFQINAQALTAERMRPHAQLCASIAADTSSRNLGMMFSRNAATWC